MKYFLDTEFNEQDGALISLALVDEQGHELYFEVPLREPWKPWVSEHVKPKLTGPLVDYQFAQLALQAYFAEDDAPIIICDWPADIAHLCHLLDLGQGRRMGASRWEFILQGQMNTSPEIPHHALSDARALKVSWQKRFPE